MISSKKFSDQRGYTLIEVLAAIAIIGVLAAVGLPSYTDSLERNRVAGAAEEIFGLLLRAKSEGTIRDVDMSFNTNPAATPWCAGFSATPGCDCTNTSSCTVNVAGTSVLQTLSGAEFDNVVIAESFATGTGTTFSRIRGTASQAGIVAITDGSWQLNVVVDADGSVEICNPNDATDSIPGYTSC